MLILNLSSTQTITKIRVPTILQNMTSSLNRRQAFISLRNPLSLVNLRVCSSSSQFPLLTTTLQLNYHLYTQHLPDAFSHTYFLNDDLREELQKRSEIIRTAPGPGLNLPDELQGYHTLVPLEAIGGERRKFGNWYSTVYRATSETTGVAHALRRIESEFLRIRGMCEALMPFVS
jgi:hypothetical protein